MNSLSTAKYTAFVGLDWVDAKHDICLQAAGSDQREFDCFAHRTERIEEWAQALQQRFGGRIAVALETDIVLGIHPIEADKTISLTNE